MSIATEIQRLQTTKADIKSAIEEKGVEVGNGTIDTYAEKVREISVGGGEDTARYCSQIMIEDFNLLGKEEVVLNLDNATTLQNFNFTDHIAPRPPSNTTLKHLTIICPNKITSLSQAFARHYSGDNALEHLTLNFDTSEVTSWYYAFNSLNVLKVIDGQPLNLSKGNSFDSFRGLALLEEVRFVENSIYKTISFAQSPKLSDLTIQSIIDGLATVDTAQTLTLHANTKILQSQVDSANAKGWTVAGGVVVSEEEYYG